MQTKTQLLKSLATALLATSLSVSAFTLAPSTSNLFSISTAQAEAVKVDAPRAPGFAEVVAAVSPAVVSVRVEQELQPASDDGEFHFDRRGDNEEIPRFFRDNPDLFKRFFGDRFGGGDQFQGPRGERGPRNRGPRNGASSQGSGFFVSEDGYLVTNNHVIEDGTKFTVVMDDGTELDAKLIGADKRSDLAVLKVEDKRKFTYVSFSKTDPRIGDWVVAVGNPFGLGGTVTAGIVSARNREINGSRYDDFIQIDAAVNKGNSGGPAFDLSGEVIGVNTAIFSPSGGNVGIAFAIPASTSQQIVDELISKGQIVRGWLGVQIQPVSQDIADALDMADAKGAMVTEPQEDSPASKAGIKSGDVITAVDGSSVKGPKELAKLIAGYSPDSDVVLDVFRDGKTQKFTVKLGKLNDDPQTATNDDSQNSETVKPTELSSELGLALGNAPDGSGVLVLEVESGSQAEERGIKAGDVVSSINGQAVANPQEVDAAIKQAKDAGRKSTLFQVKRDSGSQFVAIPFERG